MLRIRSCDVIVGGGGVQESTKINMSRRLVYYIIISQSQPIIQMASLSSLMVIDIILCVYKMISHGFLNCIGDTTYAK